MPYPLQLTLTRLEIEPVFGPLCVRKNWHRLEERLSKVNLRGRPLGVRLSARRDTAEVLVSAKSLDHVRRFESRLAAAPGYVQRLLAGVIAGKLSTPTLRTLAPAPAWSPWTSHPLSFLPGIGALMRGIWIDPPFRLEIPQAKASGALDWILSNVVDPKVRSILVIAPAGYGKTSLLHQAFQRLSNEPSPQGPGPIFIPLARLRLRDATPPLDWESLPGVAAGAGPSCEAAFQAGRLILFLDGLDENPGLLDLSVPAACAFWESAARNRCIISCRTRFYLRDFFRGAVHGLFSDRLCVMHLLEWAPAHTKALYTRLAAAAPEAMGAIAHLSRLAPEDLRRKLGALRLTGLSVWTYAAFVAAHNGGKFPHSEYEILDFLIELVLQRERGKLPGALPSDIAKGLLGRLAWLAYRKSGGETQRVNSQDIMETVRRDYPGYSEHAPALFAALGQLPILEYNSAGASFEIDRGFASFLAAQHLLGLALREEAEGLREALETPLTHEISDCLFQGIGGLDESARQRVLRAGLRVFESARRLYAAESHLRHVTSMQAILQPLGRLGLEEATRFLREVMAEPRKIHDLIVLSCARALAYSGDHGAVDAYLRRLERDPAAREINRNFYLFWLRDGRPALDGANWLKGLRVEGWERTCRWFLAELGSAESSALRPIHLFTFCDLAESLGPAGVNRTELKRVAERLTREADAGPAPLRRQLPRFARALRAFLPDRERDAASSSTKTHDS